MELIKMSYKGFSFSVNPSSIKATVARNLATKGVLFKCSKVQELGFKPSQISGSGRFVGNSARQDAHTLMRIFKDKGSAYLFLPNFAPMKAFFSDLSIAYNADENCVSYSFSFLEDTTNKQAKLDFGYTYALEGENLYDIANRTDVSVENLFEYNNYTNLFAVNEGDKVWLC